MTSQQMSREKDVLLWIAAEGWIVGTGHMIAVLMSIGAGVRILTVRE